MIGELIGKTGDNHNVVSWPTQASDDQQASNDQVYSLLGFLWSQLEPTPLGTA
jgi:hypothetical protein